MTETTFRLPDGACDCHTHVFLDAAAFPFAAARRYTPPPASIEALVGWQERLGVARTVIVQASVHGNDHATLRHALQVLDQPAHTQRRSKDASASSVLSTAPVCVCECV